MKIRLVLLGLMFAVAWVLSVPVWAAGEKTAAGQQYQSVTTELMSMLRETMDIIRNLDHAPTADEKRHLTEMMSRLDAMLKQQQEMMQNMHDQLNSIRQQQDEYFQRQQIIEQQQNLQQQNLQQR
jgi:paraquat-inducible protein B